MLQIPYFEEFDKSTNQVIDSVASFAEYPDLHPDMPPVSRQMHRYYNPQPAAAAWLMPLPKITQTYMPERLVRDALSYSLSSGRPDVPRDTLRNTAQQKHRIVMGPAHWHPAARPSSPGREHGHEESIWRRVGATRPPSRGSIAHHPPSSPPSKAAPVARPPLNAPAAASMPPPLVRSQSSFGRLPVGTKFTVRCQVAACQASC
jgi:hypothetical protein